MEPKPVPTDAPESRPGWALPEALEYLAQSGAANLVTEIMDDFRTDVAARLLKLRQAVADNYGPGIKIEAHSIKGSAAQMGASDLAAACLKLEIDAGPDKWSLAGPQVEAIQALFDQVCLAIGRHPLGGK
ncbi:MAG: Hpt domain-containing protein [Bryobacteraceae bacterium]